MGVAARAVEQEDGVIGVSGGIVVRLTQREVVQFQLRDGFAAAEVKVLDNVVAILRRPLGSLSVGNGACKAG